MSSLTTENLAQIEALLSGPDADPSVLQDFRQRFPGVSLTRCDPSDVDGERPYKEFARFNLFLVSAVNHCVTMTRDPAIATGIIVVQNKVKP
ncbi:hypothetical protein RZS28_06825 [Methylocapsa polymorpha]|uniref:Uncharacterized protein n=1 Tax=Methylocapsa polymorpha TaxID=3080828 RepID=A0ABZ0HW44_9HYPH|nr:hypothetical protein RZS28_06825 [Methylocapsa sp. RX1]